MSPGSRITRRGPRAGPGISLHAMQRAGKSEHGSAGPRLSQPQRMESEDDAWLNTGWVAHVGAAAETAALRATS